MDLSQFYLDIDFWDDTMGISCIVCRERINIPYEVHLDELNKIAEAHICKDKK